MKITGDGTVVSRSLHLVVIAFSFIIDEESATSPSGNHAIALINTNEDYDNEIKILQSITIDGITFTVDFFLGADWKFLAQIIGLQAATAKYFCIWCKCPAADRHIPGTWSIEDTKKGARTTEEIQTLAQTKKKRY